MTIVLHEPIVEIDQAQPDDLRLHSVTSILKEIDKGEGLMVWATRLAAECALDNLDYIISKVEAEGRAATVDWIADARRRPKRIQLTDADLGVVFHKLAERYAITGRRPECRDAEDLIAAVGGPDLSTELVAHEAAVMCQMLERFDGWLDRFQPTYIAAEYVVYSTTYGYAGTSDGVMSIPEQADADRFVANFDYKTSRKSMTGGKQPKRKRPYPETVLQLAAYRYAEFAAGWAPRRLVVRNSRYYLLSPGERALAVPVPDVDGSLCILVTPEWCEAFPMRTDENARLAFLYAMEIARWSRQTSKGAVADALKVPTKVSK